MNKLVLLAMLIGLTACSGPKIKVQTSPAEADVYVAQQGSKEKTLLGKTPLEMSYQEMHQKVGSTQAGGDYLIMTVESRDYDTERLMVPPAAFGSELVDIKLQLNPKDVMVASQILQRLHNAQKYAQLGQYERAQIECDKALEINPNFVRSLSMKGSLYYLQKNYDDALKWFDKALAIDNGFDEAINMIARIKKERNEK